MRPCEIVMANALIEKLRDAEDAYWDKSRGMPYDIDVTLRDSRFLIKSLVEDIKQRDTEIDILLRKKEALRDEIAELQAEIERLQKAEAFRKDLVERIHQTHMEYLEEAKTEAIKDFAERLKVKYKRHFSNEWRAVYDTIDNLVKEMTEGNENA